MHHFSRIINALAVLLLVVGAVSSLSQMNAAPADAMPLPAAALAQTQPEAASSLAMLDEAGFAAIIADSHNQPIFLMIYASWCPHCKRMFGDLQQLQTAHKGTLRIITLSIDNDPRAAERFIRSQSPVALETYRAATPKDYRVIGDMIRAMELSFQGGKSKSVGVPYNVVFHQGEPVAEMAGALPTHNLRAVIDDIVRNTR